MLKEENCSDEKKCCCCCCYNDKTDFREAMHFISKILWVLFFIALIFSHSAMLILCLIILALCCEEYS